MTIREFKSQMVNMINDSKLAIDVVEVVLEGLLAEVHIMADKAYAQAAQESMTHKEEDADESEQNDVCG